MKQILDLTVSENQRLNERTVLLKLTQQATLPEMQPGQFVQIRIDNSGDTFLRRPISVHYVDKERNELWLLVQTVGPGTYKLAQIHAGDTLNVILPLGNTFSVAGKGKNILLVGGGVGVAPLLYLGARLQADGVKTTFLLGARSAQELLQLAEFSKYGTVFTTTEDGSAGEKGFVTQHSIWERETFDFIYTCGPTPMMKAVARQAAEKHIACEVSLENKMACGIGACLCCITDTKAGHKCVCTDGPVFNINDLNF